MAVHAMPSSGEIRGDGETRPERTRLGRWKMMAVLLVCAAPVVASYITYYLIRPEGRRNYGELIAPQRPLPEMIALPVDAQGQDGKAVSLRSLKGQWLLLTVAPSACNEACEKELYLQRQLRESLGREKDRLDRVWPVTDAAALRSALLPALAGAQVLRVPAGELAQWLAPAPGQQLGDHLYVVDPLGNWMMRFPANIDAARAKRDLERLMRASSFWDKAGRAEGSATPPATNATNAPTAPPRTLPASDAPPPSPKAAP
jgi:hypothetical protein